VILPTVWAFAACATTTPAADFCRVVRVNRFTLSPDPVGTRNRSPEVSSIAFHAPPPDLPPAPLMDTGFVVRCRLAERRRPHHPVLVHRLACLLHAAFRPRLTARPLRFANPSPPSGWVEDFHLQAIEHARHTAVGVQHRWTPFRTGNLLLLGVAGYFFFFAFFSSTTACAAANRAIGTRNGEALT